MRVSHSDFLSCLFMSISILRPPPKPIAVPRGKRKAGRAVPEVSSVDNSDLNPDVVATCILQVMLACMMQGPDWNILPLG